MFKEENGIDRSRRFPSDALVPLGLQVQTSNFLRDGRAGASALEKNRETLRPGCPRQRGYH
jgi:hypothetical protein